MINTMEPSFGKTVLNNIMSEFNSNLTSFNKQINNYIDLLKKKKILK